MGLTHNSTHPGRVLAVPPAGPNKAVPISCQQAVPADEMAPTAGSQQTDASDSAKPLLDDWQTATATESKVTVSNEGSQRNTIGHHQTPQNGSQMAPLEEGHVMNFSGNQTQLEDCPVASWGDQAFTWGQMMTPTGDQTCFGGQTMPFNSNQAPYRSQGTTFSDQTAYGSQMTPSSADGTLWWGQMTTFTGHQSFCGSHTANTSGGLTCYLGQMTTPSGGLTCCAGQMSLLCSQMPDEDGFHCIPNFHSAQGQPLEGFSSSPLVPRNLPEVKEDLRTPGPQSKRSSQKMYVCSHINCGQAYSKSSHLRAHVRKHTGE